MRARISSMRFARASWRPARRTRSFSASMSSRANLAWLTSSSIASPSVHLRRPGSYLTTPRRRFQSDGDGGPWPNAALPQVAPRKIKTLVAVVVMAAGVVVPAATAGSSPVVTAIGATLPVWNAHHTCDKTSPYLNQPCVLYGVRRSSAVICPGTEFCQVQMLDTSPAPIVMSYNMQFPVNTRLGAAELIVKSQMPSDTRIVWYYDPSPGTLPVCSVIGLDSPSLKRELPSGVGGGVMALLWWATGSDSPHIEGARLELGLQPQKPSQGTSCSILVSA
jgi:hypothetical protein